MPRSVAHRIQKPVEVNIAFPIGATVALIGGGQEYQIASSRDIASPSCYEPPIAYTMVCGATWPHQCLRFVPSARPKQWKAKASTPASPFEAHLAQVKANAPALTAQLDLMFANL